MTAQQNNPLHGVNLETVITELVAFYGWDILATAMRFNCFKTNPTIKGSIKFLKNTPWAREKLEGFYLYKFKRMPKPNEAEYLLSPRERGFADGIVPRAPMELTKESIELSQAKAASAFKEKSAAKHNHTRSSVNRSAKSTSPRKKGPSNDPSDPWGLKNK